MAIYYLIIMMSLGCQNFHVQLNKYNVSFKIQSIDNLTISW